MLRKPTQSSAYAATPAGAASPSRAVTTVAVLGALDGLAVDGASTRAARARRGLGDAGDLEEGVRVVALEAPSRASGTSASSAESGRTAAIGRRPGSS